MKRTHTALVVTAALGGLAGFLTSVAVGSSGGATRTEAHWVITDLGAGIAVDINERGQVVGGSNTASGKGRAVLWTLRRGT